jgi:branched-chain amino acid transport system permease protein
VIPLGALLAAMLGVLLGAPVLKLRGDYLAIVTLGFGEIIRVFMNNLEHPVNITNGPQGIGRIDSMKFFGFDLRQGHQRRRLPHRVGDAVLLPLPRAGGRQRDHLPPAGAKRIGRAWMAIREDEIAAKAMGINTRNMKLLAFGMGATFGGVAGCDVRGLPGLRLARVLQPDGVVMIVAMVVLGGMGHLPGVILGAVLLAALPEVLRYVAGRCRT